MAAPTTRDNQGTGFVNYNDILNANQGAGQAEGQAVAAGLQSQGNAVNQNLQGQQSAYNTAAQGAQNQFNNQTQYASQLAAASQSPDSTAVNSVTPGTGAQNVSQLQAVNYTGPTSLKDVTGLQSQAQAASQAGASANSTGGQQQLLKQYVGGQGYTQGENQFDQALLSKYGRGAVNTAAKNLTGLNQQANTAASNAQTQAQQAAAQDTSAKNQYISQIQGGQQSLQNIGAQNTAAQNLQVQQLQALLNPTGAPQSVLANMTPAQKTQLLSQAPQLLQQYGVNTGAQFYNAPGTVGGANATNASNAILMGLQNNALSPTLAAPQQQANNTLNSFLGNTAATYNNPNQVYAPGNAGENTIIQQQLGTTVDANGNPIAASANSLMGQQQAQIAAQNAASAAAQANANLGNNNSDMLSYYNSLVKSNANAANQGQAALNLGSGQTYSNYLNSLIGSIQGETPAAVIPGHIGGTTGGQQAITPGNAGQPVVPQWVTNAAKQGL